MPFNRIPYMEIKTGIKFEFDRAGIDKMTYEREIAFWVAATVLFNWYFVIEN